MEVDYGPLAPLIGTYKGDKGMDVAPEPDGKEETPFSETLVFTEVGEVLNAEEQSLRVLHYHQIVSRKSDDVVIHNQTGYWSWDKEKDEVVQSIAIPRAVCVLAVGASEVDAEGRVIINVACDESGVIQTSFMHKKAKTTSFKQTLTIRGNELHYHETTIIDIYGKRFEHTDTNTLTKI